MSNLSFGEIKNKIIFAIKANLNIGFYSGGGGLGDKIIYTSFPENFFKNYGRKLVCLGKEIYYQYNPYIVYSSPQMKFAYCLDLYNGYLKSSRGQEKLPNYNNRLEKPYSHANLVGYQIGGMDIFLRHPRLYRFENLAVRRNRVVLGFFGNSIRQTVSSSIINYIINRYGRENIISLGETKNNIIEGVECRSNLPFWELVYIIAGADIFIGIDSGLMHIANCYPRVRKKIILSDYSEKQCAEFLAFISDPWIDWNLEYYNIFERDIGITMSFLSI